MSAAAKLLANSMRKVQQEPTEGFTAELADDSNVFLWHVYIEGPSDTLYEKGVFKLLMTFPETYPMNPPQLKFLTPFWHPNVYDPSGEVCLSILHAPGNDPMSGELPEERWLPTQTMQTVILSLISMLNEPNFSSPANVDCSVMWRNDAEKCKARIKKTIEQARASIPDHIKIPHPDTDPAERARAIEKMKILNAPMESAFDSFDDYEQFDDYEDDYDDDEDGDVEDAFEGDDDDEEA